MFKKYIALSAIGAAQAATSDHWAVIVAGSNTYSNYRHQADTCHAYQVLKAQGIPEDQIIHLAYDDVANSRSNPFPGQIFNKPTAAGTPGADVYAGCKIDYKGKDVTAKNVIAVLEGDEATAGGPVLKSNENSKVFFYFADHGAPGLVAMPTGGYLYADKFHETLKFMNANKMYKEMVVYIEACESGSMFENILEDNLNIYAVSAANASESSWGTYCSPDDKVNGKSINSCLGDLFSVNWLEDADKANMQIETLQDQYSTVQKETTKSHVLQWGQLTFTDEPIANFESGNDAEEVSDWKMIKHYGKKYLKDDLLNLNAGEAFRKNQFAVDSRDNNLHFWYNMVLNEPTTENYEGLNKEIAHRMKVDKIFETAFPAHMEGIKKGNKYLPTDFECYRKMIAQYENDCEPISDYSLKYLKAFVAECEALKVYPEFQAESLKKITAACSME